MRGRIWLRRLLFGGFVLTLLAIVGATWFTHRLMTEMLTGRAFRQNSAVAVGDPMQLGYRGDPMQAFDLPFENLTVETPLGPAPAWWVPGKPGVGSRRRAALFIHGIGGAREDGYQYLPELHAAGLPVLLVTYRNDAGAPAAPDGLRSFGLTEWSDIDAAFALLHNRGIDDVVLVAASMGGAIAGQFLARSDYFDMADALILDAPALDFPAILRHVTAELRLPLGGIGAALAVPAFGLSHGANLSQARVGDILADFTGAVLVLHGRRDRIVPPASSLALLAARQGNTTLLLTPGDHLQSRTTAPRRFETVLQDFLATLPR
ncbi:MAG: hypothetical protein A2092_01085 [Rhodobacteraceae bacterium GWE1_64_9]|nr:MAG: hypothetical protein A2092_01085 [Rhodobacteraceae bacterium GWE1_64_9]OHC49967.1 MAG: hypothetical protein A2X69_11105 [Rhodobacteraceae bacterium GWF1_65_7]HBU14824.1 hypothetical protein [Gemmobacter sp.]